MGAESCARNISVFLLHLKQGAKNNFAAGCHTEIFHKLFSLDEV